MRRQTAGMNTLVEDSIFSQRRAVRSLSIIVVGAGIGGLAIGLCMRKTGHDVREYASLLHMRSRSAAGILGSATTRRDARVGAAVWPYHLCWRFFPERKAAN